MTKPLTSNDPAVEWRSSRLLHKLYTSLGREFMIELPSCSELEGSEDFPAAEALESARAWFSQADELIPVHQLRQFLQTSTTVNEETLCAGLEHYLRKAEHSDSDRDKTDFLLVQFFSICAPALLEDSDVTLEYVAGILEPFLGEVDLTLPENLNLIEDLVSGANNCSSLKELFASGVLEMGRELKVSPDTNYFLPAALVAFTRFNFLLRRTFFRRMHQDLNAILDGLRQLEARGVETLDCRTADFSSDEPVARLRMICQSWKVMFQAEYSSGQPMRMLVQIRAAVETALAQSSEKPAVEAAAVEPASAESAIAETSAVESAATEFATAETGVTETGVTEAVAGFTESSTPEVTAVAETTVSETSASDSDTSEETDSSETELLAKAAAASAYGFVSPVEASTDESEEEVSARRGSNSTENFE